MKDGNMETRDVLAVCGSIAVVLCVLILAMMKGCEYKSVRDKAAIDKGYVGDGWRWYAPGK